MPKPEEQLPPPLLAISSVADVTPALLALAKTHCDARLRRARRILEPRETLGGKVWAIRQVCDQIPGELSVLDLCVEAEDRLCLKVD